MTLRVVIADDEAVARSRLRRLLAAHADVTVVAEAADGRSAVDVIVTQRPDVVFLDIRMPELDGFEVLAELAAVETPAIVFVTAFSDHAAKAFDVNALDYLLKPYDPARLAETLDRARERQRDGDGGRRLLAAVEEIAREQRALRGAIASGMDTNSGVTEATNAAAPRRRLPERILVSRRGHDVRHARGRRLHRVRRQLRAAARWRGGPSAPHQADRHGAAARSVAVRAHPPHGDRERWPSGGDSAVVLGRCGGDPARRHEAATQPTLPRRDRDDVRAGE
jgi:DNA-binding LytR/AlgR family response regulator